MTSQPEESECAMFESWFSNYPDRGFIERREKADMLAAWLARAELSDATS